MSMFVSVELGELDERQGTLWPLVVALGQPSLSHGILHPVEDGLGLGLTVNLLIGPLRQAHPMQLALVLECTLPAVWAAVPGSVPMFAELVEAHVVFLPSCVSF